MKLIAQGAEARIYVDDSAIVKERGRKTYRIEQLDKSIRGFRTRRETKVLATLAKAGFPVPALIDSSDTTMTIRMQKISGKKLRDILTKKNCARLGKELGEKIGHMHTLGIIHGDLTTSNLILQKQIFFIDFGLSFFSEKTEDRAVELHLVKETLRGTHPDIAKPLFAAILSGYKKTFKDAAAVIARMDVVEDRGRNKKKMGS